VLEVYVAIKAQTVITGWSATLDALLKADWAVVLVKVHYYGGGCGANMIVRVVDFFLVSHVSVFTRTLKIYYDWGHDEVRVKTMDLSTVFCQ
jgi:hypothetical protein